MKFPLLNLVGVLTAGVLSAPAAATAAPKAVSYFKVMDEYQTNPKAAAKKYDGKRLVFAGSILTFSDTPSGFIGAVGDDGAKFDTDFAASQRSALAKFYPGGKIKAFTASKVFTFECLNGGLHGETSPGLKLTDCKIVK